MDLLPEDVLTDVLRRLPPRDLAVSRSVCREWRAIVDARCDLRKDLLPTTLGGIFVMMWDPGEDPEFLVRPSMKRTIDGRLQNYEGLEYYNRPYIVNCCNGLLLLDEYDQVVNPATRQWARLPPYPASPGSSYYPKYLVFDPTLSPPPHYYEVLAMQDLFCFRDELSAEGSQWPPLVYTMGMYSSSTTKWEERLFAREEGSATTIAYVGSGQYQATYLNRALYIYWCGDFIMRITLFNDKYTIINLPAGTNELSEDDKVYLGKSKNRIHFALVDNDQLRLQVWFLNELGGNTEWILKHGANLTQISYFPKHDHGADRPWILQYGNNKETAAVDNGLDWNSDEDNALDIDDMGCGKSYFPAYIDIFGFHPYREILFLYLSGSRVVAYYFNASKIQDLGEFRFGDIYRTIHQAFIYTPCWNGELFVEN